MNKYKAASYFGYVVLFLDVAFIFVFRYINMQLTESQLLFKYFPVWILCAAVALVGYKLVEIGESSK